MFPFPSLALSLLLSHRRPFLAECSILSFFLYRIQISIVCRSPRARGVLLEPSSTFCIDACPWLFPRSLHNGSICAHALGRSKPGCPTPLPNLFPIVYSQSHLYVFVLPPSLLLVDYPASNISQKTMVQRGQPALVIFHLPSISAQHSLTSK